MALTIDPSERWLILGKTGSGKTEWAKYMLRLVAKKMPVVIIDPKMDWLGRGKNPPWEKDKKQPGTVDKPHLVEKFNPKWKVQCFQPDTDDGTDDPLLMRLCLDILKKGDIFVYFDELDGIASAQHVPTPIRRIWKQGRSLGVGAWASTQVPSGIPRIFKSQAEKFAVFKVGEEDIELAASLARVSEDEMRDVRKWEWIFYETDADEGDWQPPVPYKKEVKKRAS